MPSNPLSILDSVKKVLGLDADYTEFDIDVMLHINSTFGVLQQMGVGPVGGFEITDNSTLWSAYSTDMLVLSPVKSYIYQKVRLMFDPPATSFGVIALEKVIAEFEFRLNIVGETLTPPSDPFANT